MTKESAKPLLTICIPTYNRAKLLRYTIEVLKEQIVRNLDEVELIICDNASTDETNSMMLEYGKNEKFFSYVHYTNHLDFGGDSIVRSTENANGSFLLVYGDDDIPMPYMVDVILDNIKKYPNVGYIGFNRLRGNSTDIGCGIEDVHVAGQTRMDATVSLYDDISDYAEEHQNEVGFISVNILRTELWRQRYKDVYPNNHRGYEFILPYLYSAIGQKCIYIQSPLCVQRLPSNNSHNGAHTWADKRLLYFYLGRPRAIWAQEKYGIIKDAKKVFESYECQFGEQYLLSLLLSLNKEYHYEEIDCAEEMASYLSSQIKIDMVRNILSKKSAPKNICGVYYKIKTEGMWTYFARKVRHLCKNKTIR